MNYLKNKNVSCLQFILTLLYVVSYLLSNIITAKQIMMPFGFALTAGVIIFPLTYIISDIFSEIYGYSWSRITCYIGFIANLFMVIVFYITLKFPYPEYWSDQNAFITVLGNTPRIFVASACGYIVGDFINDRIFRYLKCKHNNTHEKFGFRAIISSFFGELLDSLLFFCIAFVGVLDNKVIIQLIYTQFIVKLLFEIIILPITHIMVHKVSKIEEVNKIVSGT